MTPLQVNMSVTAFGQRSDSRAVAKMELAAGLWDQYHGDGHDTAASRSLPGKEKCARQVRTS